MKNEKLKKFFSSRTVRSAIVGCAVLLVGLAIYLNYKWFYDPLDAMGYGDNNMEDNYNDPSTETGGEEENSYFTSTVTTRQEARDEAIEVLKLIYEDEEASEEARAEAGEKISKIALDIQNEANIESLVKAKGFAECVAIVSEDAVSVIVSAEQLTAAEAAQILTIVYETTGIQPSKISIINK